jgi:rRNA-processing protein FCF1
MDCTLPSRESGQAEAASRGYGLSSNASNSSSPDNDGVIEGRLYLKAGVQAAHALKTLRSLIAEADGLTVGTSGAAVREAYVRWIENVESQLAHLTHDHDVIEMLQSDRYWQIRAIHNPVARPLPLVTAERDLQKAALSRLADDLDQRVQRFGVAPGQIAVLDTNILLHYQEPQKIRWREALGATAWRLVIPLRVVEELDAKKYSGSTKLAPRARALLPLLERLVGEDGSARELEEGVTIEVPVEPGQRSRPSDADEEILGLCAELAQLAGDVVTLVTNDTGMRLRARAQGTDVAALDDKYLRVREQGG